MNKLKNKLGYIRWVHWNYLNVSWFCVLKGQVWAKRLIEIGAIFDSMGITSTELANEFKNHFTDNEKSKLWLENFVEKNKA